MIALLLSTNQPPKDPKLAAELRLIQAAQKDPQRFAPLYDKYYRPIFIFVHKRVKDSDLAGDLTSQVFLKALLNINKYEYRGFPFSSWLFRIAVNEVNMHFRSASKNFSVTISESMMGSMVEEAELENTEENQRQMIEALNELPEDQSQMIELRFFEHYSFKQLGDFYRITEANAKVRVYRIMKKMKKIITLKGRNQA